MLFFNDKIEPITIETERFVLKRWTALQLARETFSWTKDIELMRTLGVQTVGMTEKKWRKSFKSLRGKRGICWAIFLKGTEDFVGYHTIQMEDNDIGQLTVVIKNRDWWGKNAVIEIRTAVCDYMFTNTACTKLYGLPRARNLPSIFNYQSLGFKVEGVMRQHAKDLGNGKLIDVVIFGLLRDEWKDLAESRSALQNSNHDETTGT